MALGNKSNDAMPTRVRIYKTDEGNGVYSGKIDNNNIFELLLTRDGAIVLYINGTLKRTL